MARLIYTSRAQADLTRLAEFLLAEFPSAAATTESLIREAVNVLENHPLIGRRVDDELRELLVSRGRSGYAVLYSWEQVEDVVLILAIRHQRETGY